MSDFQFRTRGQQIPQGKQRVYFTCHPDDFEKFFEEIQKEILDRQDCAVFYLEPNTQPEDVEDYELRLREMQLFVVPVTTKLLTKANRAMDVEVPFAFENHIPVLPLMQESGLDDVFNAKFGDLQYLDKHNTDPTAIPFEEKLTKYLESVIVGDELAKKVRAAFDAYIFLSYRKKDRKYAQELMKLIHSNPLCRDIAIWYDEFLAPGENFNEAIRAALEKSELFALAVTPNLINEINYILTTEYPMARDMGKKILPAEMEHTDREKLHNMYDDIPELIEKGDTTALAERLSSLFESFAIRENDSDPQHNFFIALAYLGGIDVEVNYERAVRLITGSAETGYIPAIKKLVSMFNCGEGVRRDYHKAVAWQKKLVEQSRKNCRDNRSMESKEVLLSDLCNLGEAYISLKQLDRAKDIYEEMRSYSEYFAIQRQTAKLFLRYQANSYTKLGNICQFESKLDEAEEWYLKALSIIEYLAEKTETIKSRRDLYVIYYHLGKVAQNQMKLSEAEQFYSNALLISKSIMVLTETVQAKHDLSNIYNVLGDIAMIQGKLIEAENLYHKGISLVNEIIEKASETTELKRDLSNSCNRLGDVAKVLGRLREAEEWYRKGYKISEEIATKTETLYDRRGLTVSYNRLGDIAQAQKKLDEAIEWYSKSLDVCESLAEETNTIESYEDLAVSYNNIGIILHERLYLDKALSIYKQLSKQFPDNPSYHRRVNDIRDRIQKLFS